MLRHPLFLALVLLLAAQSGRAADPPVRHIVLVSVDGLSASYLSDPRAEMPNLRAIAALGV